jgi:hypothetical protein
VSLIDLGVVSLAVGLGWAYGPYALIGFGAVLLLIIVWVGTQ